jgi:hypothetical protein
VEVRGNSNHIPIVLEIAKIGPRPPSSLKFNYYCLKEEEYKNLVMESWIPLVEVSCHSFMHQFVVNLCKINKSTVIWAKSFRKKSFTSFQEVESEIGSLLIDHQVGSLSREEESELGKLLKKKQYVLVVKESKWHLKSKAIWLREGDNNTILFHKYASPIPILSPFKRIAPRFPFVTFPFSNHCRKG